MSRKLFYGILATLTIYRLWLSTQVGLGADEAHYFLYGKFVDWSYFDHPPMVGWIQFLFQKLPLPKELMARGPAILCALLSSLLLERFLTRRGFSEAAARWGVLAVNSTLLFNLLGILWLPDTPLLPLTLLILEATEAAEQKNDLSSWMILGFWLGLAGLTKYTAIFFVLSLGIYFLRQKRWKKLLSGHWLLGVVIALGLLFPLLRWNLGNDFMSFKYQGHHIFGFEDLSLNYFLQTQAAQLILWGIGFYILAWRFFKLSLQEQYRHHLELTWIFCALIVGVFILVSFSQLILPHWLLIPFTLMIAIEVARISDSQTPATPKLKISLALSTVLTGLLMGELGFHFLPKAWRPGIYKEIVQWDQMIDTANQYLSPIEAPKKGLAVMNWTLASRAMFYNTTQNLIFVLDDKFTQFDLWNPQDPKGYDLVILLEDHKIKEYGEIMKTQCNVLKPLGHLTTTLEGTEILGVSYFHCQGHRGLPPKP